MTDTGRPRLRPILVCILTALLSCPSLARLDEQDAKKPKRRNPLRVISKLMNGVANRLRKKDTGVETQKHEERIVDGIDKLIEIARKQQQQQKQKQQQQQKKQQQKKKQSKPRNAQSQKKSQKPMQSEQAVNAKTTTGRLRPNTGAGGTEWGNLPPRAREEFLQILKEDFPESYKHLVRYYFKNLSEQQ